MISVRLPIASVAVALSTFALSGAAAQPPQPPYPTSSPTVPYTPPAGRCLTPEQRKVNDAYNQLDRPTRPGDEMPFWDPEYFAGTWDFLMRMQESPLGPGGESAGTLTITATANGCTYAGTLKGDDPEGKPFTRTLRLVYDTASKGLTWTETDSRGYTLVQAGPVGGELGGLFHHHFGDDPAAPASTLGSRTFRLKGVTEMSSPAYFKTDLQISLDGAPFRTLGRVTYEKQLPDSK